MSARAWVLDTGALVAVEKGKRSVVALLAHAWRAGISLHVPTVVVVEAWRGGRRAARVAKLLGACEVEPLFEDVARAAGEALGAVRGATAVDAVVVACARALGAAVVTSDEVDLRDLAFHLGGVPLIPV